MAEKTLKLSDHIIPLEGVTNARDLGGYLNKARRRIKVGKLLRTGQLYTATERDIKTLREDYNVGTIIDFRSGYETILHSDPVISGAAYYNLPVLEFKRSEAEQEKLMKVYAEKKYGKRLLMLAEAGITADTGVYARIMFGEPAKAAYKSFFELLLENDEEHSVLFHCTQGKDRTGIAAALLLTLLDIPEEVIMEDYLLTNNVNSHIIRADIAAVSSFSDDEFIIDSVRRMNAVQPYMLEYAFARAKVEYGSVRDYIKKALGVSEDYIHDLNRKYLV